MGCIYFSNAQKSEGTATKDLWFSTVPNTHQKSLDPYYKALKTAKFGPERFSVIEQLAAYHIDKANSDSIIQYGNLYLREIRNWDQDSIQKSIRFSKAYYILGLGSRFNGLIDNAIKWHIEGIKAAESSNNKEYLFRNKIALANSYNLKQIPDKAIATLEQLPSNIEKDWPELMPDLFTYLGDSHFINKEYESAKTYFDKALSASQNSQQKKQELTVKLKLGTVAELNKNYQEAFTLYNQARESGMEQGFHNIYFEGTIRMGELFLQEKNYDAAVAALSVAYINAIERDNLYYQRDILNIQRRVFAAKEDFSNAYAVMTQLAGVNSQIANRQQQKVIRELEVQYETLQKEKSISDLKENQILQEAELKRQRTIKNAVLIGFLVVLIPILGLLFLYYQKLQTQSELARKQEEINQRKVEALKNEQELSLIKASIEAQDEERKRIAQELHDSVGGNLAGIKLQVSGLTEKFQQLRPIGGQLDETYQLVRNISHNLVPKKFKQNTLTDLIDEYISSMTVNGGIKINFQAHPKKAVNGLVESVQLQVYKIIQELITNTLKHANASEISINLAIAEAEASLLFEDNGVGFDTATTSDGIGFQNIKTRVNDINGELFIDSSVNRGTVVSITFPTL
ncbi:histidine kinase [Euzebyella marina]|nr:sensor histidine kinase [Euzebyella marina]